MLIFLLSGLFNKDTWSSTDGDESLISSDLIDFLLLRVLGIFTLALSPDFVLGLKFFLIFWVYLYFHVVVLVVLRLCRDKYQMKREGTLRIHVK